MSSESDLVHQDIENLSEVLLGYFDREFHTDLVFSISSGDDTIYFSAHKMVLSMWSPVFVYKFFNSDAKIENAITITDVTPAAFEVMLRFMYGSDSALNCQSKNLNLILETFKAATQYEVEALRNKCKEIFLSTTPNKMNVFQILHGSKLIDSEMTRQLCLKLLQLQTTEVLSALKVGDVTLDMIIIVLDLPKVSFSSEYELVMWVFDWAKNRSEETDNERSFRSILEEVLPFLNFTAMTSKDFSKVVEKHKNAFSEKEGFSIFMNIENCDSWTLPTWANTCIKRAYS